MTLSAEPIPDATVRVTVLGSGSRGNSYVVTHLESMESIVIDAGISRPKTIRGQEFEPCACFITHTHGDHVNHVYRYWDCPIYVSHTECMKQRFLSKLKHAYPYNIVHIHDGYVACPVSKKHPPRSFFTVTAYHANHDTEDPLHYVVWSGRKKLFFGCDTHGYSPEVLRELRVCDAVFAEYNYDDDLIKMNHDMYPGYTERARAKHTGTEIFSRVVDIVQPGCLCATHLSSHHNTPEAVTTRYPGVFVASRSGIDKNPLSNGEFWI